MIEAISIVYVPLSSKTYCFPQASARWFLLLKTAPGGNQTKMSVDVLVLNSGLNRVLLKTQ